MARHSSVWFRKTKRAWYSTVDGKQVMLATEAQGKRRAVQRLGELLAGRTQAIPVVPQNVSVSPNAPPVGRLVTDYLEDLLRRRGRGQIAGQTKADVERRLAGFVGLHGKMPSDQIRPHHIDAWLETRAGWGKTSRHDGVSAVKAVFRWALKKGHIERNPLADLEKPRRAKRREVIPSPADIDKAFAAILTPELADLLTFTFETGCRPKEARTLEARHLDRLNGVIVLPEHKTVGTTGKPRVLYLTILAAAIAFRLADLRPTGPIFLNSRGRPWTHNAVGLAVRRLRKRAGLGKEMVAYALRHAFATDALARHVPVALVAELMGHSDLRMMGTYSHVSDRKAVLKDAAIKAKGGNDPPTMPP